MANQKVRSYKICFLSFWLPRKASILALLSKKRIKCTVNHILFLTNQTAWNWNNLISLAFDWTEKLSTFGAFLQSLTIIQKIHFAYESKHELLLKHHGSQKTYFFQKFETKRCLMTSPEYKRRLSFGLLVKIMKFHLVECLSFVKLIKLVSKKKTNRSSCRKCWASGGTVKEKIKKSGKPKKIKIKAKKTKREKMKKSKKMSSKQQFLWN